MNKNLEKIRDEKVSKIRDDVFLYEYGFNDGVKAILESEELKHFVNSAKWVRSYPRDIAPQLQFEEALKAWHSFTGEGENE